MVDFTKLSIIPVERLLISLQYQSRIPVVIQTVMILCHQRYDFQLRMHHKAFGGRAPPGLVGELTALPKHGTRRRKERRERKRKDGGRKRVMGGKGHSQF